VIEDLKAAAPALSIELTFVSARTPEEFGPAFATISRAHCQALFGVESGLFSYPAQRTMLLELGQARCWAMRPALPMCFGGQRGTSIGS